MGINRVQGAPFAQIANAALRDQRLSFRARGILAMVLSHTGEWQANREWIARQSDHEGRHAIQTALNELTALGYRRVHKERHGSAWVTVTSWYHTPYGELVQESTQPGGELVQDPDGPRSGGPRADSPRVDRLTEHHLKNTITEDKRVTRKRATPAPDRFPITDDMRTWAAGNAPGVDLEAETLKMLDHARANGKTYKDWMATWRNWMRRSKDYAPTVHPRDRPTPTPPVFDPAALLPSDPIPMPDNVRQLLTKGETA